MNQNFGNKIFRSLTILGVALVMGSFLNAGAAFAQETSTSGSGAPTAPTCKGGGSCTGTHGRHHKHGFFMGMCVGQALMAATPPVIVPDPKWATMTKDQRKAAREANKPAIEAAKAKCRAAFKANHPIKGGTGSGGSES